MLILLPSCYIDPHRPRPPYWKDTIHPVDGIDPRHIGDIPGRMCRRRGSVYPKAPRVTQDDCTADRLLRVSGGHPYHVHVLGAARQDAVLAPFPRLALGLIDRFYFISYFSFVLAPSS
jgi:hypothetical protein